MRLLSLFFIGIALLVPVSSNAQGCMEGGSDEGVNVICFIQPQFDWLDINDSNNSQASFGFNRARLGVTGSVPYDFSYYFMMEFSPRFDDAPYMLDGFITYTRFGDPAKFTFGQFKQPFSLERNMPCHALYTVNRSMVVEQLAMDRDMGFMFFGDYKKKVSYNLAVMNGTGLGAIDDNNAKDWVGRVVVTPITGVDIGGGFRYGTSAPSVVDAEDDTHTRGGLDLAVTYNEFKFFAEYIYGKDEGSYTEGGGCGGPGDIVEGSKKRNGMYAMLVWSTKWNLEPVYKYEFFEEDMDLSDNTRHGHTFGLNYYPNDWTRLQINYLRCIEDFRPALRNDKLLVQMQIKIM
jgi:phosphate-selective porin